MVKGGIAIGIDTDAWAADGFVVVRGLLDARTVAALQTATDVLEAAGAAFVESTAVGKVFYEVQSASGRKREPAVFPGAFRKITGPSKSTGEGGAAFSQLRRDARVVEVVTALGLRRPRCVVDQVNFKHPRVGTPFPFHQDAAFLHGDAKQALQAHGGVNVVVALDAADAGNGGFIVLAGTHGEGELDGQHGYDTSTMAEDRFDGSRRETPSLLPGDAVFFHPHLAHGSEPNRSERRRRLVTLWFVGGVWDA
jgi:hypothetical protein